MPAHQQKADLIVATSDSQTLNQLKSLMENQGYRCVVAPDAATARERMAAQSFDLLVVDARMPGESGLELIKFVKDTYPRLAVIALSAANDSQAKPILELGVHGCMAKPFEPYQALITIQSALIRRKLELDALSRNRELELTVRRRTSDLASLVEELTAAKSKIAGSAQFHKDQLLFMQTLLDAIPNPLFYKDTRGVYQGCNQAFEAFIGKNRQEIIGQTAYGIAPKELADKYYERDQELILQSGKQVYEGKVKFADGSLHDVLFSKATFAETSGKVAGMVAVMIDITELKEKEHALRLSEEKNRMILDNIGLAVAVISPRMEILEMNNLMHKWFPGVKADGKSVCFESFSDPPRSAACGPCPTKRTLADGQVHEAVVCRQGGKGNRDLKIISSPILDKNGKVVAAIELIKDITEEIAMERELQQSQKMASIGQLAAGVAHEINNPTGFVSSNLGSLQNYVRDLDRLVVRYRELKQLVSSKETFAALQPAVRESLLQLETVENEIDLDYIREDINDLIRECMEGTDRIRKIVEDLKHFAHPGQDKVQDTDINRELESTLNVVNNELKYKASVIRNFNPLPIIQANPQQLNQVFVNILVNAAQAIEKDGEIRIDTKQVNGYVQIRIGDNGCGISPQNLTRIFDPFFTTKEVGKGTGLGMNIAYNIIRKHKGTIEVESEVGKGTIFTINLPSESD